MSESIKQTIQQFLKANIKNYELQENDDYFEMGIVNSLFAMQIVNFVEKQFHFTVENEDLELKNFNSINALTQFVTQKLEQIHA